MKLVDQYRDKNGSFLRQKIAGHFPDNAITFVKHASLDKEDDLPKSSFAYQEPKLFPIHNKKQACLSKMYASKQASYVPEHVMNRINKAVRLYNEDPSNFEPVQTKEANHSSSDYLLPHQNRLFVNSADDVKEAAHTLLRDKNRLKTSSLIKASERLLGKASEYDMGVDDIPRKIYKYAGATTCDAGKLLDWVEARWSACTDMDNAETFDKIASEIKQNFPEDGVIEDRDELIKIATVLTKADKEANLDTLYDRSLLDPVETVFNREKLAAHDDIDLAGQTFSKEQIQQVPLNVYEDILGKSFDVSSSKSPEFVQILKTLPQDMKQMLARQLQNYV